jgi:nitrogen fixation protein NifU and related proteins
MSDLHELYQELILDHARHPRNFRSLAGANRRAEGHNPLCGDRVTVEVREREGVVEEVGFLGQGCSLCLASASTMTECVKGRSRADVDELFKDFRKLVTTGQPPVIASFPPKLAAFGGVALFPMRVKCTTLAWHALAAALAGEAQANTE